MKKILFLIIVIAMVPSFAFSAGESEDDQTIEIAYMNPALQIPFWKNISDGIKQEAATIMAGTDQEIVIIDSDSQLSAATQLSNAQDLITRGVDGIIISPVDSAAAPSVLELAAEAGIPVIIADIGTDSGDYVSFVISDNYDGAYQAGRYLGEKMAENGWDGDDVAQITISLARENGRQRTQGFEDAMREVGSDVVQLLECSEYTRGESYNFAGDLLTANEGLRGIFTQHDEANLGALAAIEDAGVGNDLIHVGFDGSPETTEAIKDGRLAASAMQQPVTMGRESMRAMWTHLQGDSVDTEILVPTILVTTENVEDIEEQLADNVYPAELQQ